MDKRSAIHQYTAANKQHPVRNIFRQQAILSTKTTVNKLGGYGVIVSGGWRFTYPPYTLQSTDQVFDNEFSK